MLHSFRRNRKPALTGWKSDDMYRSPHPIPRHSKNRPTGRTNECEIFARGSALTDSVKMAKFHLQQGGACNNECVQIAVPRASPAAEVPQLIRRSFHARRWHQSQQTDAAINRCSFDYRYRITTMSLCRYFHGRACNRHEPSIDREGILT